jgi:hypothetical protein
MYDGAFKDCMVDLETLGTRSGSVILSIGAVLFTADDGGKLGHEFYTVINTDDSMAAGLTCDASTLEWWSKQSDEAKAVIRQAQTVGESQPIRAALLDFSKWLGEKSAFRLWGNGAAFDNALIAAAYAKVDMVYPIAHWNDMCYRTLKKSVSIANSAKPKLAHHALEDAKAQAINAITMIQRLREYGEHQL